MNGNWIRPAGPMAAADAAPLLGISSLFQGLGSVGLHPGGHDDLGFLGGPALATGRLGDQPGPLVAGIGAFVGGLVYPVWCLLVGRRHLRGASSVARTPWEEVRR